MMSNSAPALINPVLEQIVAQCHPRKHADLIKATRYFPYF